MTTRFGKRWLFWLAASLVGLAGQAGASDAFLPDGSEYRTWEVPLKFSKTYYVDGSSGKADDKGPGTAERPFKTIGKAAELLQAGERVVIGAGIYRECVRPARGGTGPEAMISYEAAPGAGVFVRGSEALNDGWTPGSLGARGGGGAGGTGGGAAAAGPLYLWRHELTAEMFPTLYNPFALPSLPSDWAWLDTRRVDMGPYLRRRGLVFVDGKPLEPMEQLRELGNTPLPVAAPLTTQPAGRNGLPGRARGGPVMQEMGGSAEGRFYVENAGNALMIRVPAATPAKPLIEVTTREQVFVPAVAGLGYIRLKGITFQHAGNGYPPPQHGLVSTMAGNHWIVEGNTIEWANGVGLDIGGGSYGGGTATGSGIGHIIRGNVIRYCGVEGIGGPSTRGTVVEDNLIEWCGWADAERGWESAAAKFHGAQGLLFRRNVVRHIRHANAVWLDSGNSNCRITGNVLADVETVSAAIHMEMNRNYNQIDNNIIWDVRNAEPGTPGQRGAAGSGIFEHATDRLLIAQNLIGKCENAGLFAVLRPERNGAGTGAEDYVYNNIFVGNGKAGLVFLDPKQECDGNVYAGMAGECLGFFTGEKQEWLNLAAWRDAHGWDKNGAVSEMQVTLDVDRLELRVSNMGALAKCALFNHIDHDMVGKATGDRRVPGPLVEYSDSGGVKVDPRQTLKGAGAVAGGGL